MGIDRQFRKIKSFLFLRNLWNSKYSIDIPYHYTIKETYFFGFSSRPVDISVNLKKYFKDKNISWKFKLKSGNAKILLIFQEDYDFIKETFSILPCISNASFEAKIQKLGFPYISRGWVEKYYEYFLFEDADLIYLMLSFEWEKKYDRIWFDSK